MTVALVGDHGTGKSSLFRHLTGQQQTDEYTPTVMHGVGYRYYEDRDVTIIDLPGNVKRSKNCIRGLQLSDFAVGVFSAKPEKIAILEEIINGRDIGKSILIVNFALGTTSILLLVSSMDIITYQEEAFTHISALLITIMKRTYPQINFFIIIPTVNTTGENITFRSDKMPWYSGPILNELIRQIPISISPICDNLELFVTRIFKKTSAGIVLEGKICSGELKIGMNLRLDCSDTISNCTSIHIGGKPAESAEMSQIVYFQLQNPEKFKIELGTVVHRAEDPRRKMTTSVISDTIVIGKQDFKVGYSPTAFINFRQVKAKIEKKHHKFNIRNSARIEETPILIKQREGGSCTIKFSEPVYCVTLKYNTRLGRIIYKENDKYVGASAIREILN